MVTIFRTLETIMIDSMISLISKVKKFDKKIKGNGIRISNKLKI